jgi:hypothetical protein
VGGWRVRMPGYVDQPPQATSTSAGRQGGCRPPGPSRTRRRAVRPGPLPGCGRPPVGRLAAERQPLACPLAGAAGRSWPVRAAGAGPSRLSEADWRRVENAPLVGAVAQGFDTERRSPAGGRRIGRGSRGALTQPSRGPVGQPQGRGAGQPCLRFVGGVGRRRAGRRAGARRARAVGGFPHQQGFPCECHLFHEAVALSARWLRDGRPGCSRSRHRASTLSQPKPSAILNRWTSP